MSEQVKLEKSLSPLQVCALALGSIVGWGCFVLPGDMFLPQAGPVGTLLGFFVGACLISFVAVCLSYMVKYALLLAVLLLMRISVLAPAPLLFAAGRW